MAKVDIELRRLQTGTFQVLGRVGEHIVARVAAAFTEAGLADITPAQANVLMILFEARGPLTARAIASEMRRSEVTVGRFAKRLESRGWVTRTRDPGDSRAVLITTTDKARQALPLFIQVSNSVMDEAFAGLDPAALRQLLGAVRCIQENVKEPPDLP